MSAPAEPQTLIPPGHVRAGDAIGKAIKCECGRPCGGVAVVGDARGFGWVTAECTWGKRNLRNDQPVVIVPMPDVKPDCRPIIARGARP